MTTAHWMLLIAAILPPLTVGMAKVTAGKRYDNASPRNWLDALPDDSAQKRLVWAEKNAWEFLAMFTVVILIAHQAGIDQSKIDFVAQLSIANRFMYTLFYYVNIHYMRTISWSVGLGLMVWLLV